uniref:Uncharacterized protein n=1 Tax=Anguilla anguilla TaxID=7936 RepID=A0A0E9UVR1_ANGAN
MSSGTPEFFRLFARATIALRHGRLESSPCKVVRLCGSLTSAPVSAGRPAPPEDSRGPFC